MDMKPIFHTFEVEDRHITLCATFKEQHYLFENYNVVMVGWAILRPGDKDKTIKINNKEVNYGKLLAEGRANKAEQRCAHLGNLNKSVVHPKVIEQLLISFQHHMSKNLKDYIAAL